MKRLILIQFFFMFLFVQIHYCLAQGIKVSSEIPRDTSFTLNGTVQKITKDYPEAKPVLPVKSNELHEVKNLVYSAYGERNLRLDLFSPQNTNQKLPGVILVHGGGWRSGDRSMEIPMAQHLAMKGYITATAEHRLSPEAKYPAAVSDIKAAVRWMRANSEKYNIDSNKIALYGVSSGGHLAAMVGATNGIERYEGNGGNPSHSSDVQAVIDIDGVLDFTDPAESGKDNDPAKPSVGNLWLGSSYKDNPDIWIEASPLSYVTIKSPPYIFINSSLPRFHAGRDIFIGKLNSFNIYSEVHTIAETPHPFWLFHPWFDEAFSYIKTFLDKTLKGIE